MGRYGTFFLEKLKEIVLGESTQRRTQEKPRGESMKSEKEVRDRKKPNGEFMEENLGVTVLGIFMLVHGWAITSDYLEMWIGGMSVLIGYIIPVFKEA